jgi:hypothetical protein
MGHTRTRWTAAVLTIAPLLLSSMSARAADPCSPPEFKDWNFRQTHDLTKIYFLDTVDSNQYSQASSSFKGNIIIPYIDVPASANYDTMKSQINQVKKMTKLDFKSEHQETIESIGWSELSAKVYIECLRAHNDKLITLEPFQSDPYEKEFFLRATFKPNLTINKREKIKAECIGCTMLLPKTAKIDQGGQITYKILRMAGVPLKISIEIAGRSEVFLLPAPPIPLEIHPWSWTVHLDATELNQKTQDKHLPQDTLCWPSDASSSFVRLGPKDFKLHEGEEFIVGNASAIRIAYGGHQGYASTEVGKPIDDSSQVCFKFNVVEEEPIHSYYGEYRITLRTISRKP